MLECISTCPSGGGGKRGRGAAGGRGAEDNGGTTSWDTESERGWRPRSSPAMLTAEAADEEERAARLRVEDSSDRSASSGSVSMSETADVCFSCSLRRWFRLAGGGGIVGICIAGGGEARGCSAADAAPDDSITSGEGGEFVASCTGGADSSYPVSTCGTHT